MSRFRYLLYKLSINFLFMSRRHYIVLT